jgi:DNA-binding PadR family transcriptional regulator
MHPIFQSLRSEWRGHRGHFHQLREEASAQSGHEPHHFGAGPFGGGHGRHFGGPFGFGGGGPFGRGRRGARVKRGDVRAAILTLLAEQPRNGYQLIQEIAERSGGAWKPSSGAVYPALQQLEDEGLIKAEENDGKRQFTLTEAGELFVREQPEEAPWEAMSEQVPDAQQELQALLGQVMGAGMTLAQAASPAQLERAKLLLNQTRRSLYQILAEEE